jgi:hypothetical protein
MLGTEFSQSKSLLQSLRRGLLEGFLELVSNLIEANIKLPISVSKE